MSDLKFYTFMQNNSGGVFHINDYVSHVLVIEAKSYDEAERVAKEYAGIYYDGCDDGVDCPCCGDRWYPSWDQTGHDVPTVYGEPLSEYRDGWAKYYVLWKYVDGVSWVNEKVFYGEDK